MVRSSLSPLPGVYPSTEDNEKNGSNDWLSQRLIQTNGQRLDDMNVDIVSNTRSDCELVIMRQMSDQIQQTINNLRHFVVNRSKLYEDMRLRSRQRNNYQTLLNNLHVYIEAITLLKSFLYILFTRDFKVDHSSDILCNNFKSMISLCENFRSNNDLNVNKWDKCRDICSNIVNELGLFINKLNLA